MFLLLLNCLLGDNRISCFVHHSFHQHTETSPIHVCYWQSWRYRRGEEARMGETMRPHEADPKGIEMSLQHCQGKG